MWWSLPSDAFLKYNHFPDISDKIRKLGADLVAETASAIESDIAARWSDLRIPVRIINQTNAGGKILATVSAGDRKRFWAAFVENGTYFQAPRPAVTPAAERQAQSFHAKARNLERDIR
jgi:hypothetical protein